MLRNAMLLLVCATMTQIRATSVPQRTTYLGKIADDPSEITPTISLGITIDHAVAMSLPILSGYIWERFGFRFVFLMAAAIALVGFFVCLRIRVPSTRAG